MAGCLASIFRHPVKGFTPERLAWAELQAGGHFPCDRLYAVERGPSGFDPAAPAHMSKWRFAVLANHPRLACATTRYDAESATFRVELDGALAVEARLDEEVGRSAFAAWLAGFLAEEESEPLRVLDAGPLHRFVDDEVGFVSLVNLESLRDLGGRIGRTVDPRRMRANLYVDGWAAWSELAASPGAVLRIGDVEAEVIQPIPRCIATHVDPDRGERDIDLLPLMRAQYGHVNCGIYLKVTRGGRLSEGDALAFA